VARVNRVTFGVPPTLAHRIEYGALRAFSGVLSLFRIGEAARAAGAFTELGYAPLGIRRGVTERQIAAAFPEWSAEKVEETARESYRNLGRVAIEATLLSRGTAKDVLDLFNPSPTWSIVESALAKGRGVILVAGHLGNWELSGAYVAARGVPVYPIARGMSNPLSDAYFRRTRERLGMHIMHDQEAVRRVPRVLREGHTVGFLSDQATVGLASTFVPFFGRPAKTPRGAAVFALRGEYPVVMIHAIRMPNERYEFIAEEIPVTHTSDRERDVDDVMVRFSEALERMVKRFPGQYFWQHRRWKHQPDDTPPELREP
jgi:KDO2-lipid IV(A) lauroyltransferase